MIISSSADSARAPTEARCGGSTAISAIAVYCGAINKPDGSGQYCAEDRDRQDHPSPAIQHTDYIQKMLVLSAYRRGERRPTIWPGVQPAADGPARSAHFWDAQRWCVAWVNLGCSFDEGDNRQTSVADISAGRAGFGARNPDVAGVRSAMMQHCHHRLARGEPAGAAFVRGVRDTDNAAHDVSSRFGGRAPAGLRHPQPSTRRSQTRKSDGE